MVPMGVCVGVCAPVLVPRKGCVLTSVCMIGFGPDVHTGAQACF